MKRVVHTRLIALLFPILTLFAFAQTNGLKTPPAFNPTVNTAVGKGAKRSALSLPSLTTAQTPSLPPTNASGAYVATLARIGAPETDFLFAIPGTFNWVTSRNHYSLDFFAAIDIAPGGGNSWALSLEYATLSATQSCDDVSNWTSVPLCTLSGSNKSCVVRNKPVYIIGPACFHGRAVFTGTTRNLGAGTASLYFRDGPIHFQGSGGASANAGVVYGGNVLRSPNQDRAYWISPGVALKNASGVVTVPRPPGAGKSWNIKIASSTNALTPGQNCASLTYTKSANVCTISGSSQKQCNWSPVSLNVPASGCVQLEAACSGGNCATGTINPHYGLDMGTSDTPPYDATEITYETAGSGAFDNEHSFGIGPWAISDLKPVNGNPTMGQQYWVAPATGLSACAGAFTFEQATSGTGQYDIGLTFSTTAPSGGQGCLDLTYTDSAALCSMRPGEKSCSFPLTPLAIPPGACFALNVKTSGGVPTNTGQFNWQATCTTPTPPWNPVVVTTNNVLITTWTFQGRTYAYVKLTFPDAGYRVADWGQIAQSGNDFTANAIIEQFTGTAVQGLKTTAQIYDLGPLAPGTRNFFFKNSGILVASSSFTVSGTPGPANPIDDARVFVRRQYLDFLNREPDGPGWDFWTDNITKCSDPARRPANQTEAQCIDRQRESTSGAFFVSPEFQNTGYFVLRVFRGSLNRMPYFGGSSPLNAVKDEFTRDVATVSQGIVVNNKLSPLVINANKQAYVNEFVTRAEFKSIYDSLNNTQYVDKLFQSTGVTPTASERAALINGLTSGAETRASVLFKIVDGTETVTDGALVFHTNYGKAFYDQQYNPGFVQMEYFGYLRRDPDDAGYSFWLDKLNRYSFFVDAEMVRAFIISPEYRARFGQP